MVLRAVLLRRIDNTYGSEIHSTPVPGQLILVKPPPTVCEQKDFARRDLCHWIEPTQPAPSILRTEKVYDSIHTDGSVSPFIQKCYEGNITLTVLDRKVTPKDSILLPKDFSADPPSWKEDLTEKVQRGTKRA